MAKSTTAGDAEVLKFYNDHPFPDFDLDKYNDDQDLLERASWYFKLLDTFIPDDASIVEVGCGTGQLVNFFALKRDRHVTGIDISKASLHKATQLRDKLQIKNLRLINASLFDYDPGAVGQHQYTFCNGVLHHTGRPYEGFLSLLKIVPQEGYVITGYYDTIARIPLKIAQATIREGRAYSTAEKRNYLNKNFTISEFDEYQIDSWFSDQLQHPREHGISVPDALRWFCDNGVQYLSSFPPIEIGKKLALVEHPRLGRSPFKPAPQSAWKYTWPALKLKEISWMLQPRNEGGYYTLIGQRKK
jgi:SAM-dependent methyltransferase